MKILVFSDSHGRYEPMERVLLKESPDLVLHTGDGIRELRQLSDTYSEVPMRAVRGNCDFMAQDSVEKLLLECCGVRILMTHGHLFFVKQGLQTAIAAAKREGADVLLFGHTHIPLCTKRNGVLLANPGSIAFSGTYGLLTADQSKADFEICQLN